jgi:hypothetical protein
MQLEEILKEFDGTCETFINIMENLSATNKTILKNENFIIWKTGALHRILASDQKTNLGSCASDIITKYLDYKALSNKNPNIKKFLDLANQ